MKITVINDRTVDGKSDGASVVPATLFFSGAGANLPKVGSHGDIAYCFSGTDKGKVFIFDAEEEDWIEQE